jgi:hypothetical protein
VNPRPRSPPRQHRFESAPVIPWPIIVILVTLLLGWAGYSAWRQVQTLRALPDAENLPPEDLRYMRNQAWLRLTGSGLMVTLAALLALSFIVEKPAQALLDEGDAARARGEEPADTPEHRLLLKYDLAYWIVVLLVMLGMVGIALADMMGIRRFGQRHYRKIQEDRRAMIARQVARLRRDRNGHN